MNEWIWYKFVVWSKVFSSSSKGLFTLQWFPLSFAMSLSVVSSSVSPWFVMLRLTPSIHLSLGLNLLKNYKLKRTTLEWNVTNILVRLPQRLDISIPNLICFALKPKDWWLGVSLLLCAQCVLRMRIAFYSSVMLDLSNGSGARNLITCYQHRLPGASSTGRSYIAFWCSGWHNGLILKKSWVRSQPSR
jgi:hypothetical protein